MANPVGRPRTKLNDLPADWESIICMAAQDGAIHIMLSQSAGKSFNLGTRSLMMLRDKYGLKDYER